MIWRGMISEVRRSRTPVLAACLAVTAVLSPLPGRASEPRRAMEASPLPLHFVASPLEANEEARFVARMSGLSARFARNNVTFRVRGQDIQIGFVGANPTPDMTGEERLAVRTHYFLGNEPGGWRADLPAFRSIVYHELYPGIDLRYSGDGERLKSDFMIAPGADPAAIHLRYPDEMTLRIGEGGGLIVAGAGVELREDVPAIYQEVAGRRTHVEGRFRLLDDGAVGFALGAYDRAKPLVVDPVLSYSTYLGGAGMDSAKAIAVDASGYLYVAGYTDSANFPVKSPFRTGSGGVDVFVAKLDPSGASLVYSTYIGGGWDDRAFGIAVDAAGNAYVTGWTSSPNFPTTVGSRQRVLGGGRDAFLVKLNAAGNALVYSTFLGGANHDSGNAIAVNSAGNAYVAGDTYSTNFPVLNAFQTAARGRQEAFVSKLNAGGSALVWSTYVGGYGDDYAGALCINAAGNVVLTGGTDSANFPTLNAVQSGNRGGQDAFVTKLAADGKSALFSTYLGGSGGSLGANEMGTGIKLDASGNVYVAGITSSMDFPAVNALQPAYGGSTVDGFVAKLNASGSSIIYSTYLGGYGADYANGISVSPQGIVSVAGYTSSTNFPNVDPVQSANAGGYDAFVVRLVPQGNAIDTATYWGGAGLDVANAIHADAAGNTWIAGQTLSADFPLKSPVQAQSPGSLSAFVAKIGEVTVAGAFRAANGNTMLTFYGSSVIRNAGGVVVSEIGSSQNSGGNTYVVARSQWNQLWMNIFQRATQAWKGWLLAGNNLAGNPAVAALPDGQAFVVARDASSRYWFTVYQPASGFSGWALLGGPYASDPVAAWSGSGSLYVLARDAAGVIWSGRYTTTSGFQGWVSSPGSTRASGKPSVAIGSDSAAYVAIRGDDGALWMSRVNGETWGSWYSGGGSLGQDPEVAATGGRIFAAVTNPAGAVSVQPFLEGTVNGWQGWISDKGTLEKASIAAIRGRYFIVGKNPQKELWWYQSNGAGWTYLGSPGLAASNLSASPR